jgi:hypothetical protein
MRTKVLAAAAGIALLFALYAGAGYWLAPRLLHDAVVERAAARNLRLEIAAIRTDPFHFTVEMEDVSLAAAGQPLGSAKLLSVDLAWASLWRKEWVIERVDLARPRLRLHRGPGGDSNWHAIGGDRSGARPEATAPPDVTVREVSVSGGTVSLVDRSRGAPIQAELVGVNMRVDSLSTPGEEQLRYAASALLPTGGTLSSEGSLKIWPLNARGTLVLSDASLAGLASAAALAGPSPRGRLDASAAYDYDDGSFVLQDVAIRSEKVAWGGVELSGVEVDAPVVSLPAGDSIGIVARANVAPQGRVSAKGSIGLAPAGADLQVRLTSIALAQAQRWLPEAIALDIVSGALSGSGQLRVTVAADGPPTVSYQGSASVAGLRLEERGSGALLLGWELAETADLGLDSRPPRVGIGELHVTAPEARIGIERDGTVSLARLVGGARPESADDAALEAAIERLRIARGALHFADRSLPNPLEVVILDLDGSMAGFSTSAANPAQVRLAGRVKSGGSARIRGTINMEAPRSLADFTATFRNLTLSAFNPYIARFAGYRIRSGRLSAELSYELRDGRLEGTNDLAFQQMQLGEKVVRGGARDLPLDLVVALLTDSNGRINLDIPVSGNLNDPEFDFGGIVAQALGNTVRRIVSAPFRALAAVVGGDGRDLGDVAFEPGSSALTPPAGKEIAQVAQALAQRPQLELSIQGGYDAEADAAALRERRLRQELAARAGNGGRPDQLDLRDPEIVRVAETLLVERGGSLVALAPLADDPRYGRVLLDRLASLAPELELELAAMRQLASERARAVHDALLDEGIDAGRLRIGEPAAVDYQGEGVRTELVLAAAGSVAGDSD